MFQDTGPDLGGRYPHRRSGMRLITQRSQVQILPPLQVKVQVSGPLDREIERAADVDVRRMYAAAAAGHRQMWADPGECVVEEPLLGGARVTSPTRSRLERRRLGGHCPR